MHAEQDVAGRLLALADALPDGGAVTLDADALRRLAGVELTERTDVGDPLADLRVEDVAEELGRATSTIRGWCHSGRIPGAYRLRGREWRVPRASVRRFLDQEAAGDAEVTAEDGRPVDLGRWRRHVRRAAR